MDRSKKSTSSFTPGALTMVGLRLADPFLQFSLLRDGYMARFMHSVLRVSDASALAPAVLAVPGISSFSIGGLNEVASSIVAMYGIAGLRHVSLVLHTFCPRLRGSAGTSGEAYFQDSHVQETEMFLTLPFRHTGPCPLVPWSLN